jgi:hypothetical protein
VQQSSWADRLAGVSWRLDVKTKSRHIAEVVPPRPSPVPKAYRPWLPFFFQMNEPAIIVELKVAGNAGQVRGPVLVRRAAVVCPLIGRVFLLCALASLATCISRCPASSWAACWRRYRRSRNKSKNWRSEFFFFLLLYPAIVPLVQIHRLSRALVRRIRSLKNTRTTLSREREKKKTTPQSP